MKTSKAVKKFVQQRANGHCEYCLSPADFSPGPFAAEHIIPTMKGGSNDLDNLAFSCQGCNGHKFTSIAALDPLTMQTVRLFNPRHDVWNEHFQWSEDFTYIIGITPVGRATVERLQLNRPTLLNFRKALIAIGIHPPDF
ncbi:MAG: HNH endonuclease [Saprospiraceae bacterium]|nr:HNH endonuclease [Saprospiraceae bacterium]